MGVGGRLIHHTATQGSHNVKTALMGIYGLDPEQVLVVTPDPLIAGFLPRMTMAMFTGVYGIAWAGYQAVSVPTSTTPNGAFRGAGRPEATATTGAGDFASMEMAYDADANPLTTNFADYLVISATELPSFELIRSETPTDRNLLGAKGVGESGAVGATAAVQNAVIDALSPFGISHLDMPLSPERVWKAMQSHV